MTVTRVFALSILTASFAVAAGGARAADQTPAPTRADVKALVLAARASGELRPAGEATEPFAVATTTAPMSRRQVRDETLQARANGELIPAGEGMARFAPTVSMLARADVRESVRQARLHGELIPAGEGLGPVEYQARARTFRGDTVAVSTRR